MQNRSISTSGLRLPDPAGGVMSPLVCTDCFVAVTHVFPSLFIYLCIYTLKLTKGVVLQNMHIQS